MSKIKMLPMQLDDRHGTGQTGADGSPGRVGRLADERTGFANEDVGGACYAALSLPYRQRHLFMGRLVNAAFLQHQPPVDESGAHLA